MLKKATIGILSISRARILKVRFARQAYSAEVSYEGREWLWPCWITFLPLPICHWCQNFLEAYLGLLLINIQQEEDND